MRAGQEVACASSVHSTNASGRATSSSALRSAAMPVENGQRGGRSASLSARQRKGEDQNRQVPRAAPTLALGDLWFRKPVRIVWALGQRGRKRSSPYTARNVVERFALLAPASGAAASQFSGATAAFLKKSLIPLRRARTEVVSSERRSHRRSISLCRCNG